MSANRTLSAVTTLSRRAAASAPTLALCALSALQGACDDPLALPQQIEGPRALTARASVQGRPEFAWPAPGETVDVDWLVVSPEQETSEPLSWRFEACLAQPVNTGFAQCRDAAFASVDGSGPPALSFSVPSAVAGAPQISLQGVICVGGEPVAQGLGCLAGEELSVALSLGVADAELQNTVPSLAQAQLFLGENAWEATSFAGEDCAADASLPRVTSKQLTAIRLSLVGVTRDALGERRGGFDQVGDRETLQIDWYSTAGRLATPTGFIEANDPRQVPELSVDFRAPSAQGAGVWTRFFFVSRDRRGGSDWIERGVCVVP